MFGRKDKSVPNKSLSALMKIISDLKSIGNDLMSSLSINKSIVKSTLEDYCNSLPPQSQSHIKSLIDQFQRQETQNLLSLKKNLDLKQQVMNVGDILEERKINHNIEIGELTTRNEALQSLLDQKTKKIDELARCIENSAKMQNNKCFYQKCSLKPTAVSISSHNELEISKSTIKKLRGKVNEEYKKRNLLLNSNKLIRKKNEELKGILKNLIDGNFPEEVKNILLSINDDAISFDFKKDMGCRMFTNQSDILENNLQEINGKDIEGNISMVSAAEIPYDESENYTKEGLSKLMNRVNLHKLYVKENVSKDIKDFNSNQIQIHIKKAKECISHTAQRFPGVFIENHNAIHREAAIE